MAGSKISVITDDLCAADIVKNHYRTASVFKKYGIEYCCGGKWPLKLVCETQAIDCGQLLQELNEVSRLVFVPASLPYHEWKTEFLTDYIINVHHRYLKDSLSPIREQITRFVDEHKKKYPQLAELDREFNKLERSVSDSIAKEEKIIFPYIRQIAHAYESKESYTDLLIRTLKRPSENILHPSGNVITSQLERIRKITDNYTAPDAGCTSHRLSFSLLSELDNDLEHHMYLENNILFPRAIKMEKELLERNNP